MRRILLVSGHLLGSSQDGNEGGLAHHSIQSTTGPTLALGKVLPATYNSR
jgi:hypothetical protein